MILEMQQSALDRTISMEATLTDAKVVLITGASRGIGRALALGAARDGHDVVINYLSSAAAAEAVRDDILRSGRRAVAVQADVSAAGSATTLVAAAIDAFGRLDCVVNNAGVGDVVALDELDEERFTRTIRANLVSAFLVSQAAVPHMMATGGRLVFLSSGAARIGGRISAAYAASKAGVEGLMHYYATYLRPHRITANAIAPSLVESDMVKTMNVPTAEDLPMGRLGRAEEMWPAVRMIIETEYMTGQTIHLDAGRYMT